MSEPNFGVEEKVAREIERRRHQMAQQIAGVHGPAPGARPVSDNDLLDYWNDRDNSVDVIHEYVTATLQGLDHAKAAAQATMKAYPNRAPIMLSVAPNDPEGQAKFADKMQRMTAKQMADQAEIPAVPNGLSSNDSLQTPEPVQVDSRPQQRNEYGYV